MKREYENQVRLLVNCLPIISEYDCFALKGGTAINLFYRNLPRLSVDIDLSYVKFSDRKDAFEEINDSLENISNKLKKTGIWNFYSVFGWNKKGNLYRWKCNYKN